MFVRAKEIDERAEDRLGDMEVDGATSRIDEEDGFLDGVDAEDGPEVDDVLPSEAHKMFSCPGHVEDTLLDVAQAVGEHEGAFGGVEDVGVVVVGLHVDDLVEVDDV